MASVPRGSAAIRSVRRRATFAPRRRAGSAPQWVAVHLVNARPGRAPVTRRPGPVTIRWRWTGRTAVVTTPGGSAAMVAVAPLARIALAGRVRQFARPSGRGALRSCSVARTAPRSARTRVATMFGIAVRPTWSAVPGNVVTERRVAPHRGRAASMKATAARRGWAIVVWTLVAARPAAVFKPASSVATPKSAAGRTSASMAHARPGRACRRARRAAAVSIAARTGRPPAPRRAASTSSAVEPTAPRAPCKRTAATAQETARVAVAAARQGDRATAIPCVVGA